MQYEKLVSYWIGEKYTLRYTGGMVRLQLWSAKCSHMTFIVGARAIEYTSPASLSSR